MRPLDLVLDVGKTRCKLLVLGPDGEVLNSIDHASRSREEAGYLALDTDKLEAWLRDALAGLGPDRSRLGHATVSAHGAAFALVDDNGLVLPVPDYEFTGFEDRPADWAEQIGSFDETLSPDLPRGLNGATQLDWLERHHPGAFQRGRLMPYAQYWAWWLSGQAASEVSSLGCHTHLWNPAAGGFSALARRRGWAARFAPLQPAWAKLGPLRPELSRGLGLPHSLQVHVGAHDSNACLARHLAVSPSMTLVSSGTWTVVMAPGAQPHHLDPARDLLGNVSVDGQCVPTGRFMGGRELQHLCAGADPSLADEATLHDLVARGVMALPGFESQGGPFRCQAGAVRDNQGPRSLQTLESAERATLAALYCAQVTAWLVNHLGGMGRVVVEGPFSHNRVYTAVLAALLQGRTVLVSTDPLEGTARGAWQLIHWTEPSPQHVAEVRPAASAALAAYHARWLSILK